MNELECKECNEPTSCDENVVAVYLFGLCYGTNVKVHIQIEVYWRAVKI